eukprot:GHVN01080729.1.p1 GENE.GHVN01080729.1~~GHVN01080729.1.p1  ORF type:complete len:891 (-),score=220.94 GHVN01080729.1:1604-4276(-)
MHTCLAQSNRNSMESQNGASEGGKEHNNSLAPELPMGEAETADKGGACTEASYDDLKAYCEMMIKQHAMSGEVAHVNLENLASFTKVGETKFPGLRLEEFYDLFFADTAAFQLYETYGFAARSGRPKEELTVIGGSDISRVKVDGWSEKGRRSCEFHLSAKVRLLPAFQATVFQDHHCYVTLQRRPQCVHHPHVSYRWKRMSLVCHTRTKGIPYGDSFEVKTIWTFHASQPHKMRVGTQRKSSVTSVTPKSQTPASVLSHCEAKSIEPVDLNDCKEERGDERRDAIEPSLKPSLHPSWSMPTLSVTTVESVGKKSVKGDNADIDASIAIAREVCLAPHAGASSLRWASGSLTSSRKSHRRASSNRSKQSSARSSAAGSTSPRHQHLQRRPLTMSRLMSTSSTPTTTLMMAMTPRQNLTPRRPSSLSNSSVRSSKGGGGGILCRDDDEEISDDMDDGCRLERDSEGMATFRPRASVSDIGEICVNKVEVEVVNDEVSEHEEEKVNVKKVQGGASVAKRAVVCVEGDVDEVTICLPVVIAKQLSHTTRWWDSASLKDLMSESDHLEKEGQNNFNHISENEDEEGKRGVGREREMEDTQTCCCDCDICEKAMGLSRGDYLSDEDYERYDGVKNGGCGGGEGDEVKSGGIYTTVTMHAEYIKVKPTMLHPILRKKVVNESGEYFDAWVIGSTSTLSSLGGSTSFISKIRRGEYLSKALDLKNHVRLQLNEKIKHLHELKGEREMRGEEGEEGERNKEKKKNTEKRRKNDDDNDDDDKVEGEDGGGRNRKDADQLSLNSLKKKLSDQGKENLSETIPVPVSSPVPVKPRICVEEVDRTDRVTRAFNWVHIALAIMMLVFSVLFFQLNRLSTRVDQLVYLIEGQVHWDQVANRENG